jgi:glycosyltransferase involved in cell wall biosynthesis
MNACDALLFPSWIEGSPNAVKEAMACNLPVVGSDAGDIPELLSRGVGNHVVPVVGEARLDEQARLFADALAAALEVGRSTSRAAMEDLSAQAVAQKLRQVYERVL